MYDLLRTGPMVEIASALMKEPAVLYKEKVNYKLTGESKMDSLRLRNLNQKITSQILISMAISFHNYDDHNFLINT